MDKRKCYYILLLFVFSCSAEKINLSPLGENSQDSGFDVASATFSDRKDFVVYSSEITNLIASFPKFRNDAVNSEVKMVKSHLRDYVDAMKNYNIFEVERSYSRFERSYKKLQKLRKYLNADEDEVLNRYLVRIKINMNHLQTNLPQDSLSSSFKN